MYMFVFLREYCLCLIIEKLKNLVEDKNLKNAKEYKSFERQHIIIQLYYNILPITMSL